jgi:hypothetical protein
MWFRAGSLFVWEGGEKPGGEFGLLRSKLRCNLNTFYQLHLVPCETAPHSLNIAYSLILSSP